MENTSETRQRRSRERSETPENQRVSSYDNTNSMHNTNEEADQQHQDRRLSWSGKAYHDFLDIFTDSSHLHHYRVEDELQSNSSMDRHSKKSASEKWLPYRLNKT